MQNNDVNDEGPSRTAGRQQRIEQVMRDILPGIDAYKKRQRHIQHVLVACALVLFFTGGYAIGQSLRPLSYSEKMIVQVLIEHTAQQQKRPPEEITRELLAQLGAYRVRDIRSHQLKDALMILGQYSD